MRAAQAGPAPDRASTSCAVHPAHPDRRSDDAGRLLQRVDGRDIVTNYSYTEAGGALTDIAYPDYSSQDVSFGYDALGRRTSMSDAEGSHAYAYDDAGTLLSHAVTYTGLSAKTVSYTYHPNGSRATMTTPAGTQTYGYDAAGRMTSLQYGLGTASWQYQDNNLLARQTLPNGCYTEYGYNAANQLTDLVNKTSGGNTLSGYLDFLYLGTGDLATVTSSIPGATSLQGQVDYGYDHKRQLTLEDSDRNGGYSDDNAFDGAGNATQFRNASKTYNADNQLTGPGTYVYDGNGNPTTWSGTSLTFDVENRMTAYGTTLTAGYRGDGLRAWKNTASGQTYFLYDGISVVCELDGSGSVIAGSTYGAAGLLSRGSVQYQFDNLGDATIRLDGSGNVLSYRLFDAWGNELTSGGEPYGYRARYGYYADGETGLIALAFRYYAPGVGRFLNRDPVPFLGGTNSYGYVRDMPLFAIDAAGLCLAPLPPPFGRPAPRPEPGAPGHGPLSYGNYCGPLNTDPHFHKPPWDQPDACCMEHDKCFQNPGGCGSGQFWNPGCAACTRDLMSCLEHASCAGSPTPVACELYRRKAIKYYARPFSTWWPLPCGLATGSLDIIEALDIPAGLDDWLNIFGFPQ